MGKQDAWFGYDWEVHGESARFLVDTSYQEPPAGYETLLYIAAAPADPEAAAFSPREERRLRAVERKLLRALRGALYVGDIDMAALRQYYFYVSGAEAAVAAAETLEAKEKALRLTSGTAEEPDWLTYHALLMPDAAKYQTELNRDAIAKLKKHGDGLSTVRRLTFFVGFPTEQTRLMFQEKARFAGFAIGNPQFKPELELPHVLPVFALSSLEKPAVDKLTTNAIRVAEPFGGALLRWSTPVVPRRSPLA